MSSIGVAFITHNARDHLPFALPPILNSPLKPKVFVVNSSSTDGTVELAKEMGAQTIVIPRSEFNHGLTREKARKMIGTEIIVMMTPDAYAEDEKMLEKLIAPILEKKVSVSYARQLPHHGADFFESFPREFNYPEQSQIRSIEDLQKYGVYTIFCSNSCAAYRNDALDKIGGFSEVLTGEDTLAVAKLLQKGHRIAYVAEARVRHSHRYSLRQEFQRHFDTGLARNSYKEAILPFGRDEKRGKLFLNSMFKRLYNENRSQIPYAILQLSVKWLGYRIGYASADAPHWFKKRASSQDFYWR